MTYSRQLLGSVRAPDRVAMNGPTLRTERRLLRQGYRVLACADEVGRGALAGPVTVGMVLVTAQTPPAPVGVQDSKLLSAQRREALVPLIRQWAPHAVGHASSGEVDEFGIMAAMRVAALRALQVLDPAPDLLLLDGNQDYVSGHGQASLFEAQLLTAARVPPVRTQVKADLTCAGVAAASILAKVSRDALMVELADSHPDYGWAANKGYAAPEHIAALSRLGPSAHHRTSWQLPGVTQE